MQVKRQSTSQKKKKQKKIIYALYKVFTILILYVQLFMDVLLNDSEVTCMLLYIYKKLTKRTYIFIIYIRIAQIHISIPFLLYSVRFFI